MFKPVAIPATHFAISIIGIAIICGEVLAS